MSNKELWLQQLNTARYQSQNNISNTPEQVFKSMNNNSYKIGYQGGQFKIRVDGLGYAKIRTG